MNVYTHPQEKWSEAKCRKLVAQRSRDAYGTLDHLPGFLRQRFGAKFYNGGCVREGKWYEGEDWPFPELPPGYKIIYEPYWFYRLIKE